MSKQRVVITGAGIVSCIGNDLATVEQSLREGRSGIRAMPEFAEMGLRSQVAGKPEIDLEAHIDRKQLRFMGDAAAYAQIISDINFFAIGQQAGVTNGHVELAFNHTLDVDFVGDEFDLWPHFAGKFDFARAQGTAPARQLQPSEVEANQLPHGIQPQAAGHDRVALKVAGKKPQIGFDVQFGHNAPQAVSTPIGVDMGDAVKHQHRGQRQAATVGTEQTAFARGNQLFIGKGICHV